MTLRGLTDDLEVQTMSLLGDEITYTPESGSPRTFKAWVTFGSDHVSVGSSGTKATPTVEVRRADVPDPKAGTDRLTIAIRPGLLWSPTDAQDGATGDTWILPLKMVRA